MRLYSKLFLGTGIPFGIFIGIFYSLKYEFPIGLISGLFAGLFFGGLMSLILGTIHKKSVKKIQSKEAEDLEGVHQIRKIELSIPFDKAFDLCTKSINQIKKGKILKKDRTNGKINAKASMTWKTFGDKIKFSLIKLNDDTTEVEISSRPIVRTTLVDYGKNLRNVEIIEAFLREQEESHSD